MFSHVLYILFFTHFPLLFLHILDLLKIFLKSPTYVCITLKETKKKRNVPLILWVKIYLLHTPSLSPQEEPGIRSPQKIL